jgi:ferredoxin
VSGSPARRPRRELLALPLRAVRDAWGAGQDGPRARLDRGACLAWNGVTCWSCLRPCEAKALSRDARGRMLLDATRCTACGDCAAVCPAGALTAP